MRKRRLVALLTALLVLFGCCLASHASSGEEYAANEDPSMQTEVPEEGTQAPEEEIEPTEEEDPSEELDAPEEEDPSEELEEPEPPEEIENPDLPVGDVTVLHVFYETSETPEQSSEASSQRTADPEPPKDMYGRELTSAFFFYRNSLNEEEQSLYDAMYAAAASGETSVVVAPLVKDGEPDVEGLLGILEGMVCDHPELFWLETKYRYGTSWTTRFDGTRYNFKTTIQFYPYPDVFKNLSRERTKFEAAANRIVMFAAANGNNDADKAKIVHDRLGDLLDYDLNSPYNQSAYSALVNNRTVCAGYSRAYQYCLQKLGIPATYLSGTGKTRSGSGPHAWNLVQLDEELYVTDLTWDDTMGSHRVDYFNLTDATMSKDHIRESVSQYVPLAYGTQYSVSNYFKGTPWTNPAGFSSTTTTLPMKPETDTRQISLEDTANGTLWAELTEATAGQIIALQAIPDERAQLAEWTIQYGDIEIPLDVTSGNRAFFTMPDMDVTIHATFEKVAGTKYEITLPTRLTGGTVEASATESEAGQSIDLTATPETGYHLQSWSITSNGETRQLDPGANQASFTMPEGDVAVRAAFAKDDVAPETYEIWTPGATSVGTITAEPEKARAGDMVTLTVAPAEGQMLASWSMELDDGTEMELEVPENGTVTFAMPASNVRIHAEFRQGSEPTHEYTITCAVDLTGGTVSTSRDTAKTGDTVTVTASAQEGYRLDAWSITSAGSDVALQSATETQATFKMPAGDVNVSATFIQSKDPNKVYVLALADEVMDGDVYASAPAAKEGETVGILAAPYDGYAFESWSVTCFDGTPVEVAEATANPTEFIMPASDVILYVAFSPIQEEEPEETFPVSCDPHLSGGSVSASQAAAKEGETVAVMATPEDGWALEAWSITDADGYEVSSTTTGENTAQFIMPAQSVTVSATFIQVEDPNQTYIVMWDRSPEGGSISVSPTSAKAGETVTIQATPRNGYLFGAWTVSGESGEITLTAANAATTSFTMPAEDVQVSALFEKEPVYSVSYARDLTGGTVFATPSEAKPGANVKISAKPESGYELDSWNIRSDGASVLPASATATETTFAMPDGDVTVSASFKKTEYAISRAMGILGGTTSANKTEATKGETVSITATAHKGYKFDKWAIKDDKGNTLSNSSLSLKADSKDEAKATFEMPAKAVKIDARFVPVEKGDPETFDVKPSQPDHGSVTVNPAVAAVGQTVTVTVKPSTGYELKTVRVSSGSKTVKITADASNKNRYTFKMPSGPVSVTAILEESKPSASETPKPSTSRPTQTPSPSQNMQELMDEIQMSDSAPVQFVQTKGDILALEGEAGASKNAVTVKDLKDSLQLGDDVKVQVLSATGSSTSNSTKLSTGQTVTFKRGSETILEAPVIVKGDVTGSGVMSLTQLVRMCSHFTGTAKLEGLYLEAGDLSGDGKVTLTDLVMAAHQYNVSKN